MPLNKFSTSASGSIPDRLHQHHPRGPLPAQGGRALSAGASKPVPLGLGACVSMEASPAVEVLSHVGPKFAVLVFVFRAKRYFNTYNKEPHQVHTQRTSTDQEKSQIEKWAGCLDWTSKDLLRSAVSNTEAHIGCRSHIEFSLQFLKKYL